MGNFNKKTVKDINLHGKRVIVRADYNVPVEGGGIKDDYRLRQSLPTLRYILEQKPKSLVIISHLGRPKSSRDSDYSLEPVATALADLLDRRVRFVSDCIGEQVTKAASELPEGGIMLLENLRFHDGEEKNDKAFAQAIIDGVGAEVFIQDGFGVIHRAHASTSAIAGLLPSAAGLLLTDEVEAIQKAMKEPTRPLTAIVGGAKISDKIDVLDRFIEVADCVAVGGALANNFLHVLGTKIGKSLAEPGAYEMTREVLKKARLEEKKRNFTFILPVDGVVSSQPDGRTATRVVDFTNHSLADIEAYPKRPPLHSFSVDASELILDIGPVTTGLIAGAINLSNTVIWGGTLGMTETQGIASAADPFGHGSRIVAEAIIGISNQHASKPYSLVGGGDTVSYIQSKGIAGEFNHVSTGGSASLELMAGHKLPGIEALPNK